MTGTDPAALAEVDQHLAEFSDVADGCAERLAGAITVLGYEVAVVDFWWWLEAQPVGVRGWLAAVAFAKLARQQPGGGSPPAAGAAGEYPMSRPLRGRMPGSWRTGAAPFPGRPRRFAARLWPVKRRRGMPR